MFTIVQFFTILVTLTSVIIGVTTCKAKPGPALGAITEDAQIEEGERFLIKCDLKKLSTTMDGRFIPVNSSNIFFTHENSNPIKPQIIDGRSAQIELLNSHVNDSGQYYCYVQVGNHDRQLVCYMELIVGRPPKNFENFRCVSEHYQNLTCVWTPPDYNTETTYTLIEEATNEPCPHRINKTACQWTLSSTPHYRQAAPRIKLLLNSSNKFGNHTQVFMINNFAIIRPPPPEKLYERNVSPTSVELGWEIDPTLDLGPADGKSEHPILEFQIFIEDLSNRVFEFTRVMNSIKNFTARDLIPATSYKLGVRCRTIQSRGSEEFWSEFSNITIATMPDRPYRFPVFFNESFDSIPTSSGKRSITLYWIPVPAKHSNTKLHDKFQYVIKRFPITVSRYRREAVNEDSVFLKSTDSHYTFKDLSAKTAYNFRIYSVNEINYSIGFTEMSVEKQESIPKKPQNFQALSYGNGRYELQWDKIPDVKHYVVSWCLAGKTVSQSQYCSGQLNSSVVSNSLSAIALANLKEVDYNFGVTAVFNYSRDGVASEIMWASCVVPMAAPGKPRKLPFSLSAIGTDSLRLQWKLSCPGLHVVISKFEIIYCRLSSKNGSCVETKEFIVNNSREESYTLRGLHPDSYHRVSMRMWSDNVAGEESDPIEARTGIETDITFPIIFGVLAIIMTFIIIAFCRKLFLYCKKDIKQMKQPVRLPGSLGDSYNLTKSVIGQNNVKNNHLTRIDDLRKNSGGSVGSQASSVGLLTPRHGTRGSPRNAFDSNGTELKVFYGDTTDHGVRESCADDNSNTSHDSGLGTQSNGHLPTKQKTSSKAYVTHEQLNEMGARCSTSDNSSNLKMVDGSFSAICQSSDGSSSQFTPSSVPARVRPGYVQLQETTRIGSKPVGCQNDPVVV